MKVALCFIISYDHILNKEAIWREWIEPNKDIINVYFYYKDLKKIKSPWILKHTLPPNCIYETSYYHVIPAYISLMQFAANHDTNNKWLCLLTDSCCPIISPRRFRYLFFNNYNKSIMSWKPAWWNTTFHKRANLALLPEDLRLANDPWFVLKRENVAHILQFVSKQTEFVKTICDGGLANESLFAIILHGYKQLSNSNINGNSNSSVISAVTHLADWARMGSATSPHTFKDANGKDIEFINTNLEKNKYAMFIRKVSPEFPDNILKGYIYDYNREKDNTLIIVEPFSFILIKLKNYLYLLFFYSLPLFFGFIFYNLKLLISYI
jgi:hypothetical protein